MTLSRDWQTESIRFSFLGCPEGAADLITWSNITGREADSVTVKKSQGLRNEEGLWEGGHLSIGVAPGRVDIVINPAPTDVSPPTLPSVGSLVNLAELLCSRLVEKPMPQSARLAVGAKVNLRAKDQSSVLELMNEYVPFLKVDENNTDVVFQHNVPKKIRQSGIELNRLMKWTQMAMHFINFGMPQNQFGGVPVAEIINALQFEVDINTNPSAKLPAPSAYSAIVREMFNELIATCPKGE